MKLSFIFPFFTSLIGLHSCGATYLQFRNFSDQFLHFENWLSLQLSVLKENFNHSPGGDLSNLFDDHINITPEILDGLDIKYLVYTEDNPLEPLNLRYDFTVGDLSNFNFTDKKTKFIIHGFSSEFVEDSWTGQLKNLILRHADDQCNVIGVDWSSEASVNYLEAAANVPFVAAATVIFINKLRELIGLNFDDIHFIGHSLGAHISGIASKSLSDPQVGRITGLDPAGPGFRKSEFLM